jgi:beta propeller repeat protein
VAWVEFSPTGRHPLKICKLDRATGDCFPVVVVEDIRDVTPVLSGNRLVWDAAVGDEASDVFFCELDAVRERCPVQRITAQLSPQGESAISGDRVVWIDERGGAARIQGTRLPSLLPIRDRRVRAGDWIWLPVRATDPLGGPVRMEAELASGEPLTALGARFLAPGHHGRAWLIWRPRLSQRGPWRLTFSASTLSGLVTRRTVTLEVVAPPGLRARTP